MKRATELSLGVASLRIANSFNADSQINLGEIGNILCNLH